MKTRLTIRGQGKDLVCHHHQSSFEHLVETFSFLNNMFLKIKLSFIPLLSCPCPSAEAVVYFCFLSQLFLSYFYLFECGNPINIGFCSKLLSLTQIDKIFQSLLNFDIILYLMEQPIEFLHQSEMLKFPLLGLQGLIHPQSLYSIVIS